MSVYRCKRCGMHRLSDRPPWCRHGDIELPAARMEECPPWWVRMLGFSLDEIASWG